MRAGATPEKLFWRSLCSHCCMSMCVERALHTLLICLEIFRCLHAQARGPAVPREGRILEGEVRLCSCQGPLAAGTACPAAA